MNVFCVNIIHFTLYRSDRHRFANFSLEVTTWL
jgi:hypothetical protein